MVPQSTGVVSQGSRQVHLGRLSPVRRSPLANRGRCSRWMGSSTVVSPGYFSVLGVPVWRGRGLEETDTRASRRVVLVSEALAQFVWE